MALPQVNAATTEDIAAIAEIMAEGFHDDEPMTWSFNGPGAIHPIMKLFARRVYLPYGFATISEGRDGASMWLAPGASSPFDILTMAQAVGIFLRHGGPKAISRSLQFSSYMEKHHPHEPHYYLFAIATKLSARGKGVGGALLKDGLARADADGVGAYLENSKEANLGFYGAHGFKVLEKVHPVKGSPPIWRMWRDPKGK